MMFPLYDENRSRTRPIVTWALIVVNALVFIWEFTYGFDQQIFFIFGEIPVLVLQGKRLFSLVTSMFLHVDLWHILGNMIYLFIFGDNVEDRFGHTKYLLLYLVFGIVGGLINSVTAVMFRGSDAFIPVVGASGAVSGILGAYLVYFPRAKIVSVVPSFYFMRVAPIPSWIFIGFWFILQLLYSGGVSSVAYIAHIGGFLMGFIVAKTFKPKSEDTEEIAYPPIPPPTPLNAKYCRYCGHPLPHDAIFCSLCGGKRTS